ncbi:MAG TPA: RIP metalloprotease RseP, partial [bacterium]|nr:RIP metalloprotease RseP [bacterium]
GGFCKPKGGDLSGSSAEEMYAKAPEPGEFLHASWWKRVVIFLAGPGMNFVSALLIVAVLFLAKGEVVPIEKPILGFVPPESVAGQAGLQKGDHLLTANGKTITNLETADDLFPDNGKSVTLTYERKGKTFTTSMTRPPKSLSQWALSGNVFLKVLSAMGFGPDAPPEQEWGITDLAPPIVGSAALGNPARDAGIQDGDEVVSVNGQKVGDWAELAYSLRNAKTDPIQIEIRRDNQLHTVPVSRVFNGSYKAIGIMRQMPTEEEVKKVSVFGAVGDAFGFSVNKTSEMLGGIWKMITGKISFKDNIGGPVTIMRMMYHQASQKMEDFLTLVAVISLMLFIMNLLPIPVVDGGQIVLCLIEGVKRHPVSVKIQLAYQQVGFFLIIALMALAVFNDFKNLFLEVHNHIH